MSVALVIVYIIYFPCVFYLSLLYFYEFFVEIFTHYWKCYWEGVLGEQSSSTAVVAVSCVDRTIEVAVTEMSGVLSRWHCIHLISCCLLPIAYFSTATSGARERIIQLKLGIETRYRIVFII